jgi:hypothetical protein
MSEPTRPSERGGRRAKVFLSPSQKYEIWLQLVRGEVGGVGGDDVVAVFACAQGHRDVDDVGVTGACAQGPDGAGGGRIKRHDGGGGVIEQAGEPYLAGSVAPGLGEDAGRHGEGMGMFYRAAQQRPDVVLPALEGEQRAGPR